MIKGNAISVAVFGVLFALVLLGGRAYVWVASTSDGPLQPAQVQLLELADWTVKTAVGAIVGFAGGAGLARRNGGKP